MPSVEVGIRDWVVLDPVGGHQPDVGVAHDKLACRFYAVVFSLDVSKVLLPIGKKVFFEGEEGEKKSPICKRCIFGVFVNSMVLSL